LRLISRLLGGSAEPPASPAADLPRSPSAPPISPATPAKEAAEALEQALDQVESMLGEVEQRAQAMRASEEEKMQSSELNQLGRSLHEALRRLEEALEKVGSAGERLAGEVNRLSLLVERLDARLDGLGQALSQAAAPPEPEPVKPEEPAVAEPAFEPGGQPVRIVIAAVPGFQGLMDVQRALSRLAGVEGASVKRYQNGEASLEMVLEQSLAPSQIVDGLELATGQPLLIEEARPERHLLRLRFLDGDP